MQFSEASLFSSLIISTIGTGVFMYGKKSGQTLALGIGLALMAFPYFISSVIASWIIAALLCAPLALVRPWA